MIRVALRGLLGRKLRALLTSIAIVLGVAMVSGTFVLTDAIDNAFNNIFSTSYASTDAVVSGKAADINFNGDTAQNPSVSESLLPRVRSLPNVAAASGSVVDQTAAKILDRKGKVVNTNGAPSFGFGVDFTEPRFNPLNLTEGRWPSSSKEVVIDAATAADQKYKVGDTVKVTSLGPVRSFRLVGIAQYGTVKSLGTATFAVFTIPTAQQLFDRVGKFDAISAAAKPGVTQQELANEIRAKLPPTVTVRTGKAEAKEQLKSVSFTKIIRYFLLSFGGIALFVGAFVIFNTLSITVAQRIREFATLRTIGASRRQLLTSVALEALIIGVLASILGLFGGLLLARGINALFKAFNNDLPTTGLVLHVQSVVISLAVGIIVTFVAGIFPAIRATKVPPIAAVREGATLPKGRLAPYLSYIALAVIGLSVALLAYGLFGHNIATVVRLLSLAVGVLLLFVGVALVSPRLVPKLAAGLRPIAKWLMFGVGVLVYPTRLGAWAVRRGLSGREVAGSRRTLYLVGGIMLLLVIGPGILLLASYLLALGIGMVFVYFAAAALAVTEVVLFFWLVLRVIQRLRGRGWPSELPELRFDPATDRLSGENARRNPGRTASTAAALMIGLALVTFIAVLANGMKQSNRGAVERQVKAQYMLTSQDGFSPFAPSAGTAVARSPVVTVASNIRGGLAKIAGKDGQVTGVDPKTITQVYAFDWKKGSDASVQDLGEFGAIVEKQFADDANLKLGDRFNLLTASNKEAPLEVKGIYKAPPFSPLLGGISITQSRFDQLYEQPRNLYTFVNVNGGVSAVAGKSLEAAVATFPDAKVQTRKAWIDAQDAEFNKFLITLYVLLALSVIVSLFGMVNTLVLSVFERTRELGMLRAVGMTRNQVARLVRQESVITAMIGAALGLPLGVFLAVLVTRALSQFNVAFSPPWRNLIAFAIVAMFVGVLAAVAPARRASRLNVLRALQYE
ncbi:MAG TPA: FtsX-like permease family protein [Gaiellaceae bacterium]|nr:FtsX-like permease family protein [Gaiellaceae bacterium]